MVGAIERGLDRALESSGRRDSERAAIVADRVALLEARERWAEAADTLRAEAESRRARRPVARPRGAKLSEGQRPRRAPSESLLAALLRNPERGSLYQRLAVDVYVPRGEFVLAEKVLEAGERNAVDMLPIYAASSDVIAKREQAWTERMALGARGTAVSVAAAVATPCSPRRRGSPSGHATSASRASASSLRRKRFEVFLPTVRVPSRRRDRRIMLDQPLFPGYLFLRFAPSREGYVTVASTDGVVRVLGDALGRAPVRTETTRSTPCAASSPARTAPVRCRGSTRRPRAHPGRAARRTRGSGARPASRARHVRGERRPAPAQRGRRGRRRRSSSAADSARVPRRLQPGRRRFLPKSRGEAVLARTEDIPT